MDYTFQARRLFRHWQSNINLIVPNVRLLLGASTFESMSLRYSRFILSSPLQTRM